jgi:opacity protein-like surface antigen
MDFEAVANYLCPEQNCVFKLFFCQNTKTKQSKHMKKILFPFVVALFCTAAASAQMTLRPFAGVNSSTLTDIDSANFDIKVGYQLGADLQIGSRFYIQPGLQFEFVKNTVTPQTGEESEFSRTNLRIPVLVGYSFGGTEANWAVRIFTGPNATFNLSDKSDDESAFEDLDVNSIIWGWNAGAGFDFLNILFLDLGYQFGLSEVFDVEEAPRNNLFYANAGVRIRF